MHVAPSAPDEVSPRKLPGEINSGKRRFRARSELSGVEDEATDAN